MSRVSGGSAVVSSTTGTVITAVVWTIGIVAVPVSFLCSRNIAPAWLVQPMRAVSALLSAFPDIVLGTAFLVRITTFSGGATGVPSHYLLRIYPQGSNPDSATPLYQASGDLAGGQIVLHQ